MSSRSQNHLGWKLSLRSWGLTMNLTLRSLPLNCVPEHHICTPLVYLDGWLLHCFPRQPVPYIVPLLYNSALLTDNYNGSDVAHKCFKSFTQCKCKRKKKKNNNLWLYFSPKKWIVYFICSWYSNTFLWTWVVWTTLSKYMK